MKTARVIQAKIDFLILFEEDGEFVSSPIDSKDPKNPGFITASITKMASEIPGLDLGEIAAEIVAKLDREIQPKAPRLHPVPAESEATEEG